METHTLFTSSVNMAVIVATVLYLFTLSTGPSEKYITDNCTIHYFLDNFHNDAASLLILYDRHPMQNSGPVIFKSDKVPAGTHSSIAFIQAAESVYVANNGAVAK